MVKKIFILLMIAFFLNAVITPTFAADDSDSDDSQGKALVAVIGILGLVTIIFLINKMNKDKLAETYYSSLLENKSKEGFSLGFDLYASDFNSQRFNGNNETLAPGLKLTYSW